jgi:hypothetical protein
MERTMSDFFAELEEDIREERLYALWHKYGNYIIGLALAIVIGTVGYTLWNYMKKRAQLQDYAAYSEAINLIDQGKKEEATKAFQSLAQSKGGYGKLAKLYEAALVPNPELLYTQITKENLRDLALGNLAKVLLANRSLNSPTVVQEVEPLTAPNNAWAPLSLELLALVDLKKGDGASAVEKYYRILKEPTRTADEEIRASLMLAQIDMPSSLLENETTKEGKK